MGISNNTKLVFTSLSFLIVLLLLEVGGFLILSAFEGRWLTWSQAQALRSARIDADIDNVQGDAVTNLSVATSVIHPFLGYVRNPDSIQLEAFNAESQDFGFIQNRHSLFQQASPEKVVVGVLGGSVARNLATQGTLLRHALAQVDRFKVREIVVVSLAAGGYKQPQQLMTVNYLLTLGAHLDVLLNLDGFNDIVLAPSRGIPDKVFPFYPHLWQLRVGNLSLAERRIVGKLTFLREQSRDSARFFSRPPWRYSMLATLVWKILDNRRQGLIVEAEQDLASQGGEFDYQALGPRRTYNGNKQMYQDLTAVWSRSSYQLHVLSRGLGIEYHHALQPNQYLPDSKPLSAEEKNKYWNPASTYRPHVIEGYPKLLRAGRRLRRRGVAFHNLSQIFKDVPETLYRDSCCHLNEVGNRLLAEAIAQALEKP